MDAPSPQFEQRVADRLKTLRAARGLSLEALATRSGVSRSMISLIEREQSSPTANVLDKLAASLGVTLAALFAEEEREDAAPLSRRGQQVVWRDPETGYERRNLSPPGFPSPLELVEVVLPPRIRVAYDSGFRLAPVYQQIWVLEGSIELTVGDDVYPLDVGDCLAMAVDRPVAFRNHGPSASRHLVALTTGGVREGNGKRGRGK